MAKNSSSAKVCSVPTCRHGGRPQPLSAFHKNRSMSDGHASQCRDCKLAAGRRRYADQGRSGRDRPDKNIRWGRGTPRDLIFSGTIEEGLRRVAEGLADFRSGDDEAA